MVPYKDGGANEGHSLREGPVRVRLRQPPGPRAEADDARDDHRRVARGRVGRGDRLRRHAVPRDPGTRTASASIGGITSSRCTNEEVYVVQKMVRAAFGNNNVDTCARVCHSPTGYGLKQTFGTSAGTQDFKSVDEADVIVVIGANPTDAHPVFASRMKQRLREGAKLIVVDPRRIDLVRTPHVEAAAPPAARARHQRRRSSTRWRTSSSPRAWSTDDFVAERCEGYRGVGRRSSPSRRTARRRSRRSPACRPPSVRAAARLYAAGAQRRDLLRPRRHRAQPGLDDGDGHGQPGDGHRQHRPRRRRRQPAARPEQRAGLAATWARSRTSCRATGTCPTTRCATSTRRCGARTILPEPGLRIPNMFDAALDGSFRALFVQGEDIAQSDPNTKHVHAALAGARAARRAGPVPQRDGEVRARVPARHVVPGEGRHVHQRRAPDQPGAPGDGAEDRQARVADRLRDRRRRWATRCTTTTTSQIMDEIAATTPTFAGVSFDLLDKVGSVQWPCNDDAPAGHADHARATGSSAARAGSSQTHVRADQGAQHPQVPADPDDRPDPVAVQRRRADPAHGERRPGTRRTSWRSTRTTPRTAASTTATG